MDWQTHRRNSGRADILSDLVDIVSSIIPQSSAGLEKFSESANWTSASGGAHPPDLHPMHLHHARLGGLRLGKNYHTHDRPSAGKESVAYVQT